MSDEHEAFRPASSDAAETVDSAERSHTTVASAQIALASTSNVYRDYPIGEHVVHALKNVTLSIEQGSLIALHGRSGSGKTTLLNILGGLDRPTSGDVVVDGKSLTDVDETELVDLRRNKVGFIFQAFGLVPILTADENVQVPLRLARAERVDRIERSRDLLTLVGLGERANHRPHELSGGEQQRVAIARALANSPRLLIADEPTGQLDSTTGRSIMRLLETLVRREGLTAIVATHDPALIDIATDVIELRDGEIIAA